MTTDAELDGAVRLVAVILQDRVEQLLRDEPSLPLDVASRSIWHAFENGEFRLIHDGERIGWEPTRTAVERMRLRRKHQRLVERWRRLQREGGGNG